MFILNNAFFRTCEFASQVKSGSVFAVPTGVSLHTYIDQ